MMSIVMSVNPGRNLMFSNFVNLIDSQQSLESLKGKFEKDKK